MGNDIETTVGGGDSGSPALVEIDGELVIAGVNSFETTFGGITPPFGYFGSVGVAPHIAVLALAVAWAGFFVGQDSP